MAASPQLCLLLFSPSGSGTSLQPLIAPLSAALPQFALRSGADVAANSACVELEGVHEALAATDGLVDAVVEGVLQLAVHKVGSVVCLLQLWGEAKSDAICPWRLGLLWLPSWAQHAASTLSLAQGHQWDVWM